MLEKSKLEKSKKGRREFLKKMGLGLGGALATASATTGAAALAVSSKTQEGKEVVLKKLNKLTASHEKLDKSTQTMRKELRKLSKSYERLDKCTKLALSLSLSAIGINFLPL